MKYLRYTDFFRCSYLPDQVARFIGALAVPADAHDCERLIMQGFRRSGMFIYLPDCGVCRQCIPIRIAVTNFSPNRTQRKLWAKRIRWKIQEVPLQYRDEHFQLYRRYLAARHPASDMCHDDSAQYVGYMLQTPIDTVFLEFREQRTNTLHMMSLVDRLPLGLSAVYTFFDPDLTKDSLGTFAVLWQIEWARRLNKPYVYLGYYIESCRTMAYKSKFSGVEGLIDGVWRPL